MAVCNPPMCDAQASESPKKIPLPPLKQPNPSLFLTHSPAHLILGSKFLKLGGAITVTHGLNLVRKLAEFNSLRPA